MKNTNNNTQIITKELVENSKHYFENYHLEFNKQIDSNNYKFNIIIEKSNK